MAKQLLDYEVAQRVLGASLAEGADFAEVFAEDSMSSVASLDDAKIDELSAGHSKGVGIRVIYGETTGFAYTSEFDEQSLIEAAKAARAVAKSSSEAKSIELKAAKGGFRGERVRIDKARQVELLRQMDDVARSMGKEITQVVAVVGQSSRRMTVANSDGLFVADEQ
ncbi:peptidase U62 modulator of DNA gyrase, partial [mine drainage metagenome]